MTMDTTRHIEAMGHTARALEELGRRIGFYSRDCDTLDAALKKGKSGVVIIFDEDDTKPPEVHTIGKEKAEVHVEKGNAPESWSIAYEQLNENQLAKRVAAGKSVREKHETVSPMQVGDAARKQQMSLDAKAERVNTAARIANIAQANKDFWAGKKTA